MEIAEAYLKMVEW